MEGLEALNDALRWQLVVGPFGDEVGERLRLDGSPLLEVDGVFPEINGPFGDPPDSVLISQDVAEWELDDHLHKVGLEVVLELPNDD
ncbi:hypothetical protein GUJ93_ZPchr0001g32436 [Zizania palustris]|uniref:Uncharacterized protein n=1 Tax=Zizania palustris TaxID=103762 RepID=A0A8J5V020_ZIZPA|nr:hypothetical protein GUJ93_ZPchr0001g32436 [Zizania palustris]